MSDLFEPRELDSRARAFLQSRLQEGRTLSRLLTARLALARFTAHVPPGTTEEQLYRFDAAALVVGGDPVKGETMRILARTTTILQRELSSRRDGLCLCENWLARCTDSGVAKNLTRGSPIICVGDDVYTFADSPNADAVLLAVEDSYTGRLTAALGRGLGITLKAGGQFNRSELEQFAKGVDLLVVSSYDGDGLVVCNWERNDA